MQNWDLPVKNNRISLGVGKKCREFVSVVEKGEHWEIK